MLDYLRKHHDISTKTIYNDLQGFIEKRGLHKNAYTEFHEGLTCQDRGDSAKTHAKKQRWYDDAIIHYIEAVGLKPDLVEAYNNRGNAYALKGEIDIAIQDYNKAIDLNPEYANTYNNRGVAYSAKGEDDQAIQDYNIAIELNPNDATTYCNRSKAWLHLKEWEKAKVDLMTAKDKGADIAVSFLNNYESVEDFEVKHGVTLPEDIAALLRGE